jgi:hypothetical protein
MDLLHNTSKLTLILKARGFSSHFIFEFIIILGLKPTYLVELFFDPLCLLSILGPMSITKVTKERRDDVAAFLRILNDKNLLLQHIYSELNNNKREMCRPEHVIMLDGFKFITKKTCNLLKNEFNTFNKLTDLGYFQYENIISIDIKQIVDLLLDYTMKSFLIYIGDTLKKTDDDLRMFSEFLSLQVINIAIKFEDYKFNYIGYTLKSTIELKDVSKKQIFFTIYLRYLHFFIKKRLSRKKETLALITYTMAYFIHEKTQIWVFDDQMGALGDFYHIKDEEYLLMTAEKQEIYLNLKNDYYSDFNSSIFNVPLEDADIDPYVLNIYRAYSTPSFKKAVGVLTAYLDWSMELIQYTEKDEKINEQ